MDATLGLPILAILIGVALLFDFLNGLHDAANSIATIVSTRVLRPQYAVLWAAFFNFIAFMVFGLHVANTMDFVVGAEIYKHLEKVSDRFDDVANEINSIVIEQV